MSSLSYWVSFFKGAGIPASTAKSYAASFEDNRMTKDMLLDLDKEILREMNIKMMGDIIAILKHAKTVHSEEVRKKERAGTSTTSERSAIKVAPLKSSQDIVQVVPNQKRTSTASPQVTTSHVTPVVVVRRPEVVDLTPSVGEDDLRHSMSSGQQQAAIKKVAPVIIRPQPDSYSSLHSDQALQPREPITTRILPAARQEDHSDYVHEEYTTATYEALKTKSSRTVVLPVANIQRSPDDIVERSKRMLGAAGLIAASTEEKRPVIEHKSSVFSRLGLTNESPPTQQSLTSVKSRLGSRVTLTEEDEEDNMVIADPTSVHSRLGPRKKSEPAEVTMKKIRPTSASALCRPTMVADELEQAEQVNVHDRLELQAAPAKRGRGSAGGKRSVVFQRLY